MLNKTVVVVPTYNEAENIDAFVRTIFALGVEGLKILIVDDNSPDGTGRMADELANEFEGYLSVLHRSHKAGLGPAYLAGFKRALEMDVESIIQMDADFSHDPKYIPDMLRLNVDNDLVVASRYVEGGGVDQNWGFLRKATSWFANQVYVRMVLGLPVRDATAGYRAWRRDALARMDLDRVKANGYVFQVEMTYAATKNGLSMVELPIFFPDRANGHSKMGYNIAVEAAVETWRMRGRH
ncbi:MAG: polyprenol monophosphomannose synthase [Candidatus Promineifilaceae bacterium]